MMKKNSGSKKGFTLLEVMLVVVIIAVLAALVTPRLSGRSAQAKKARAKADIANITVALGLYELDMGKYPESLEGLMTGGGGEEWQGPYLENAAIDPWGKPYTYRYPGQNNPAKFDLSSVGPDGEESDDDVTNWKK